MTSVDTLATFFGWCAVLNLGILFFALPFLTAGHRFVGRLHAKMFGVREEEARATFFRVFQQFRVGLVIFSIVPWLALKIMG
jgi:hypothetical protein